MIKLRNLLCMEEGLIVTRPLRHVYNHFTRWNPFPKALNVSAIRNAKEKLAKLAFQLKANLSEKELKTLILMVHNYGYDPTSIRVIHQNGTKEDMGYSSEKLRKEVDKIGEENRFVTIIYDPKYEELIPVSGNFLYHLTPSIYVPKIRKIGLVPKAKNKISTHTERVYFSYDREDLNVLLFQFMHLDPKIKKWSIVTVDRSKLPSAVKFNEDPNFATGLFTYRNIPPSAIASIDQVELNSDI